MEFDAQGRLRLAPGPASRRGTFTSRPIDRGAAGAIRVDWLAQWTAPQRWAKHAGNPVFGPAQSGPWNGWCNGVCIVRNPDGLTYKMFYSGREGGGIGFAEARIDDPLTWVENPVSPVLKPRADNWEGNMINQPRVFKLTDTHWRMIYSGWGFQGAGPCKWAMGVADSFDAGVTWARVGDGPIVPRGEPGTPDDGATFVPEVHRIGGLWYMWYTAMKLNGDSQNIHICLATSTNAVDWVKHPANPVLTDDFSQGPSRNVISRCCVRHEHGVFQMWYSHARPDYRIRYAESLDGIRWERSPVPLALDVSPTPAWDDEMVEYPTIDVVGGQWRLWFCGNGYGSVGFATGIVDAEVRVAVRSGSAPVPGAGWTEWVPAARDAAPQPAGRYVQVRAELASESAAISPALNALSVADGGIDARA